MTDETVDIDGETWEIKQSLDDFWIGNGTLPPNRGCIVSARSREALIAEIPKVRDRHEMAIWGLGMEGAILTAFKSVLEHDLRGRYLEADRREKLEKTQALCAEIWPWVFASAPASSEEPGTGDTADPLVDSEA